MKIVHDPEICGGRASIKIQDNEVAVWGIILDLNNGVSKAEIMEMMPGLTLGHIDFAKEYYRKHKEEIDKDIAELGEED